MSADRTYLESEDSQEPALALLRKLGYTYISPDSTIAERGNVMGNVLLENILYEQLKKINSFGYKGNTYDFSEGNIQGAITALKNVQSSGLVPSNEKVYDLLTLGKSFPEHIQGDKKSFTVKYIDWEHPGNNVYHITDEFEVEGLNHTRRSDLALFVNGIPFAVIENKRRDKNRSMKEAVSQQIRNQKREEGIPVLFHYAQLLLAVQPNEVRYAATGTNAKFWQVWKEDATENPVKEIIQSEMNGMPAEDRLPTEQDRMLYCLGRPERLMELVYKFTVFDHPDRKIARYQQYFAVHRTLKRVKGINRDGNREGGVIWHTQGSGKSLTMVMLSKSLSLDADIESPRVVIVTDRIDLDKQIWRTFNHCGKNAVKAKSGNHLIGLVENDNIEVITTIIDKFDSALNRKEFKNKSDNIFVLVDESHRSHYGFSHAKMKKALPNACYIGFTGTPLMKDERSTIKKFGGYIDTYTINQAVEDGAVLPLLYEGRSAKLSVNKEQMDKGFERLAEPLGEYEARDLKAKFSSISKLYKSQQVIEEIAYDVTKHYCENWQGTGFKAQLAVPDKLTAVKYLHYFEQQTNPKLQINAKIVISPPDTREDHDDVYEDVKGEVQKLWSKIMEQYGSQEQYEEDVIEKFKTESEEVELLIVINKLLTGFDAPRNTILYLAKPLSDHNLLQAIAHVNRLFESEDEHGKHTKEFGYIIDYVGLLGNLDQALTLYSVLEDFNEEDISGAVKNVLEEVQRVQQRYADVWDIFKGVEKKDDIEQLERHLAPDDIREMFYGRLSAFGRNLQVAMASDEFYKEFTDAEIKHFLSELRFFQRMRRSVQGRYAEKIDYKDYESRVQKLLDTHVGADEVEQITKPLNIFDEQVFKEEVERVTGSAASKADTIAYKMKKVLNERMDEDPVLYKKFSTLIEEAINAFRDKRISEAEYLESMLKVRGEYVNGDKQELPHSLVDNPQARAFYNTVKDVLEKQGTVNIEENSDRLAEAGIDIADKIKQLAIRDWKRNHDIQRKMENEVEDYLIDLKKEIGAGNGYEDINQILPGCLQIAKSLY